MLKCSCTKIYIVLYISFSKMTQFFKYQNCLKIILPSGYIPCMALQSTSKPFLLLFFWLLNWISAPGSFIFRNFCLWIFPFHSLTNSLSILLSLSLSLYIYIYISLSHSTINTHSHTPTHTYLHTHIQKNITLRLKHM